MRIAIEKMQKPLLTPEFLEYGLRRFRELDVNNLKHRKVLIDGFINAIYLYDDKILLTFNCQEQVETITFEDVNATTRQENNSSDMACAPSPKNNTTQ